MTRKPCEGCGIVLMLGRSEEKTTHCKRCKLKGDLTWEKRMEKLQHRRIWVANEVAKIEAKMQPFWDKIKKLQEQLTPLNKQRSPLSSELHQLTTDIEFIKPEAWIEGLKEGDKLLIRHSTYGDERGTYKTITELQSETKTRFKVHTIEITSVVKPMHVFAGLDENDKRYRGSVSRPENGMSRLIWRRLEND